MVFRDRKEAGEKLAVKLGRQQGVLVLGLPRGGVVVAYEIAKALGLGMDIVVPRKVGAPGYEELAVGAVTVDGEGVFDDSMIEELEVSEEYLKETIAAEMKEAERRMRVYREGRGKLELKGKEVILVDDGIATGATMRAAIKYARNEGVKKITVAVPVIAVDTLAVMREEADEVVYLDAPQSLRTIGEFYENFEQTRDEEVIPLMQELQ